jgi:hypothetical protein
MTEIQIIDCEQGTDEWFAARAGIPTASMFKTVTAKGRGGGESKTRRTYMLKLAGERITGDSMESFSNPHMERGKVMEAEARATYAFTRDVEPASVGFIKRGNSGASPDALIGDAGMLEIKTALPHILIDHLLRDEPPPEHKAQCQGQLWVAGREWVDLMIYWPSLPPLVKRIERDDKYIDEMVAAIGQFNDELDAMVDQVRAIGGAS